MSLRTALLGITPLLLACNVDVGVAKTSVGCEDDADGDGFCLDDCAPDDPAVYPTATEVCNEVDDNCDGTVDEGVTVASWADADGDTFGDPGARTDACDVPAGNVTDDSDCDDLDSAVHPSATELCNERDDDCDSLVDEDLASTWYADADGDGYGDPAAPVTACSSAGLSAVGTDCDDGAATTFPGADEPCDDVDNDCDGVIDDGADACPAGRNCLDILESGGSTGDGTYLIDPDGSGGAEAFEVLCDMTSDGGGFTQAIQAYLDALDPAESRVYLYSHAGAWYESPATTAIWDWSTYLGVDGDYLWGTGASVDGSFPCTSLESGYWGVGCSNGPGGEYKVLPAYLDDPGRALSEVCQDQPNHFGGGVCQEGVAIWVR